MDNQSMNRRDFSKSILAAGAALTLPATFGTGCGKPAIKTKNLVGIQLYTLREFSQNDFPGTVKKVAEMGYDAIEFAGFGNLSAPEVKKMMADLGLVTAGSHEGFEGLDTKLDERIEFNLGIENPNMICPSMPGVFREGGIDGFKQFAEKLNVIGEKIKQAGMQFYYHNHDFEFQKVDDRCLFSYLLEGTNPDLVKLEVDLYWVKKGGHDPIEFIQKHAARCLMLHMKDMTSGEEPTFAPVGTGILDFPAIVKKAREIGVKWFVVEQDRSTGNILEEVEISLKNMKKLLSA
ncbi:TIM barrel protein [candidate division KSB1 bacterium]|nr:TIM barrel protein [candidate division KSB1 bacterium]